MSMIPGFFAQCIFILSEANLVWCINDEWISRENVVEWTLKCPYRFYLAIAAEANCKIPTEKLGREKKISAKIQI